MSRFIDKLKQPSTGGQSMGFRAAVAKASGPKLLLVAAVAQGDGTGLAGADAGLLAMAKPSSGAKTLRQLSQAVPGIPWGGWLKEAGREGIELVAAAGGDFIVFPAGSSLALFGEEKAGKILEVEPSLELGLLKAVDDLPVDAVLINAEDEPLLTWRHLMLVQRCANLLSKPLLVLVPPEVTAAELGALWEAGVRGVVVRVGVASRIAEIRQVLDNLPMPSAGKRNKAEPLLPHMGSGMGTVTEEEEPD
jgi:hypothetical protein